MLRIGSWSIIGGSIMDKPDKTMQALRIVIHQMRRKAIATQDNDINSMADLLEVIANAIGKLSESDKEEISDKVLEALSVFLGR
jgi:hypothetical protein